MKRGTAFALVIIGLSGLALGAILWWVALTDDWLGFGMLSVIAVATFFAVGLVWVWFAFGTDARGPKPRRRHPPDSSDGHGPA